MIMVYWGMRISTAKDLTLSFLAEKGYHKDASKISDRLNIDVITVCCALDELAFKDKFIDMVETSEVGSGSNRTYRVIRITPIGWHFYKSKKRFRTQV